MPTANLPYFVWWCVCVQVCCMTAFDQEPYLLLGCSSGTVRVAALVNASGDAVSGARQVRRLQLRDYTSECLRPSCTAGLTACCVDTCQM
jgi:hypothetical protein